MASKDNPAMIAATHQTQVLPTADFKLMAFLLQMRPCSSGLAVNKVIMN
jgi:hypothetical protein